MRSHPFDERVHHALLAGAVERDGQLVAVHHGDVAVAELLVKHAVADGEIRRGAGRFRHQLALDGERRAARRRAAAPPLTLPRTRGRGRCGAAGSHIIVVIDRIDVVERVVADALLAVARRAGLGEAGAVPVGLGALPARRRIVRAERHHAVEARGAVALLAAERALALGHLDVALRQLVEEARGDVGLPQAVGAAVGGEVYLGALSRPRQARVAQAAPLLEAGAAPLLPRAPAPGKDLLPPPAGDGVP